MSELYARIEGLCKENGISVTQLCRETKINRSILTELKKGRTKYLSFETLRKISDYFKVPLDQFKENEHRMKYELWDVYETEIFDTGEILCASDDMAEIRLAAKEHIRNTNGECRLFVKEWLDK